MGSLRSLRRNRVEPEPVIVPKPSDQDVYDAAKYPGNPKRVQDLLARGGNPNVVGWYFGQSTLNVAASNNRVGVVKLLLDHGANVKHRDSYGRSPLHHAAIGGRIRSLPISRALLDHGADINARDNNGWTPLMEAVHWNQNVELVKLLLEKGADTTLVNNHGKKALDFIISGENYYALKSLLEPVS